MRRAALWAWHCHCELTSLCAGWPGFPWQAVAITSHLKGVSISIAGACIRFGRAGSGSDFDTDQSRSVYLVRLISIWYCNWFMLFMTLDMPDEGTR